MSGLTISAYNNASELFYVEDTNGDGLVSRVMKFMQKKRSPQLMKQEIRFHYYQPEGKNTNTFIL